MSSVLISVTFPPRLVLPDTEESTSLSTKFPTVPPRKYLLALVCIHLVWATNIWPYNSSLVSFTPRQRFIGEPAKTAETSNFKNTIGSLKRLIGRSVNDPEVEEFEKKFINAQLVDVNGEIGVKVSSGHLVVFLFH